jgi:citrate lyase beta subunit
MLDRLGGVAVIVELEFAAPLEDKKQAAENALIDLRLPASANLVRIIRIYSASALRFHGVHAPPGSDHQPNRIITLTRESADESRPVANVLDGDEAFSKVELARAVFVIERIAAASERVYALSLGGCDLGAEGSWESLLLPRSHSVATAATSASSPLPCHKAMAKQVDNSHRLCPHAVRIRPHNEVHLQG